MKKFLYISILAVIMLFSCSKEQPLSPVSDSSNPEMSKTPGVFCSSSVDGDITNGDGDDNDDSITDPDNEDKEKSNKSKRK